MTLDTTQLLATAATVYGVVCALSLLLQARQMLERGASCDVSLRFLSIYVGGYVVWLFYGIAMGSLPLVLVQSVGMVTGGVTLSVAIALRGPLLRPAARRSCG